MALDCPLVDANNFTQTNGSPYTAHELNRVT